METRAARNPQPDESHAGLGIPVVDCRSDPADKAPSGDTFGTCRNLPWDKHDGRNDPPLVRPRVPTGDYQPTHAHPRVRRRGVRAKRPFSLPRSSNNNRNVRSATPDLHCYGAVATGRNQGVCSEMTPHIGSDSSPLIVHVIPSPRGRGAQRAARVLVDQLDEPGVVRHRLLGLYDGPAEVELDVALGRQARSLPAQGFEPGLALRLRRVLAGLDPTAVVAHGGDAMKYALPAVIGTGRPLVYCVIGTYAGPPAPLHEWIWKRLMTHTKLVVAVGDEVLDECIARFRVDPHKAVMIPNGRDPSEFRPRSDSTAAREATLIFVGALTPQKQPDRFIGVVGRLRAEGRPVRAVMVGDGPLAETLAPLAATHGVDLLGHRSDVPELLRRSDVFVFTSRPTGEGMPGVLIEAGLSGIPAVSTPVPGATTVLCDGRTGVIVPDSVASIAAVVGELLDNPDRRAAMGVAARARCKSEFNLDLMAQRWRGALHPMVDAQVGTARRGALTPLRRASAFLRATRSRRRSSQT
jgi:glycosyltransferase involved in cell wall biosynthesis